MCLKGRAADHLVAVVAKDAMAAGAVNVDAAIKVLLAMENVADLVTMLQGGGAQRQVNEASVSIRVNNSASIPSKQYCINLHVHTVGCSLKSLAHLDTAWPSIKQPPVLVLVPLSHTRHQHPGVGGAAHLNAPGHHRRCCISPCSCTIFLPALLCAGVGASGGLLAAGWPPSCPWLRWS